MFIYLCFKFVSLSLFMVCTISTVLSTTLYAQDDINDPITFSSDPLWSTSSNIDPNCQVDIRGDSPIMYTGNYTHLYPAVNGTAPEQYSWFVEPDIVKDYDDKVFDQNHHLNDGVEAPILMEPEDFQKDDISFYWKPEEDKNRTVGVRILTDSGICEDIEYYQVEIGNSSNTQPEGFYVTTNAPDHRPTKSRTNVLEEHDWWHVEHPESTSSYNHIGDEFFTFHKMLLAHFDAYRKLFGYSPIEAWDPGTPLPNGSQAYVLQPLESWFKSYPGGIGDRERPNTRLPCEIADAPSASWPDKTQDSLNDFEPNMKLLGCAFSNPYHSFVHAAVGGDMRTPWTAPDNPLFWRFHKFIDNIFEERKALDHPMSTGAQLSLSSDEQLALDTMSRVEATSDISNLTNTDSSPPLIVSRDPQDFYPFVTKMPKLSIIFDEPVTGVQANDLMVNESPATSVVGQGPGTYTFRGFEDPQIGIVDITLSPGNVEDINGNLFEGDFWNITLLKPTNDTDSDGAPDGLEINQFITDPMHADTDKDGIPDGFETDSSCLRPLVNDRHVMDFAGKVINMTGFDSDTDGVTNVEEFRIGTPPCSPSVN
jgi:hypothetical protein